MKKTFFYLTFPFLLMMSGCAELQQVASVAMQGGGTTNTNALGLKEALRVGIDSSVATLGNNGFLTDAALKILLPPEAQPIVNNLRLIPGGDRLMNDVVQRLNSAASDAVSEAKPIFVSAITGMTISDATGILFGANDAATNYLRRTTSSQLTAAFAPKVNASLDKVLIGTLSTNDSWRALTSAYNAVAGSAVGQVANLAPVANSDLGSYVTQRALEGLFTKVATEEARIRTNPAARTSDLLRNVFGQLDNR